MSGPAAASRSIRLAYALELVFALAVGLGMARAQYTDARSRALLARQSVSARLRQIGGTTLSTVAVAGALGLAIEAARGTSPRPWGLGRATWAFTGLYVVLNSAAGLALAVAGFYLRQHRLPDRMLYSGVIRLYWGQQLLVEFAWALAAFWLVARIARWPVDASPDAREWSGRGFGVLIIAASLGLRLYQAVRG